MTRALPGSKPRISVSKKTGRYTINLPKTSVSIPVPEMPTIAVDTGGSLTKVAMMVDPFTIYVQTLPPYVHIEDVPKGASRRISRNSSGTEGGISTLLTVTATEENEPTEDNSIDKNNIVFERKGKRIVGGKSAGDLGGRTGLGESKLELLEEKVIMALLLMGVSDDSFKLSLTLPYKRGTFEQEEARVPRLLRRLSWTTDGKSNNPKAELIKVVPEAAHGHLYPMLVDPSLPDYSKIKHINIDG